MENHVTVVCSNCGTEVNIPYSELKPGNKILCPKCNLAFSHLNKIIQDAERMKKDDSDQ